MGFIHATLRQPAISLGISILSLLLLIIVLLAVPGPIKSMYWFSMESPTEGGDMLLAGILGWCWAGTTNCTYASLSENDYLQKTFDTGSATMVKMSIPLACYWAIATILFWVLLTILSPIGYAFDGVTNLARHLHFNAIEVFVLCLQLFACVLAWIGYVCTQLAFNDLQKNDGSVKAGTAMPTIAVAAVIAMIGFAVGVYGLYLRISAADQAWREEAQGFTDVSTRAGAGNGLSSQGIGYSPEKGIMGQFRASTTASRRNSMAKSVDGSMVRNSMQYPRDDYAKRRSMMAPRVPERNLSYNQGPGDGIPHQQELTIDPGETVVGEYNVLGR